MKGTHAFAAMLAAVALATAACGSDEDNSAGSGSVPTETTYVSPSGTETPFSADDVEEAFAAEVQTGRAVDLEGNSPKSISCEKGKGPVLWRCLLAPAKGGRTVLCVVTVDETTRKVSKRSCGPVDN